MKSLNKDLFIYFDSKIYKYYMDSNNNPILRLKQPVESTTNNICLLLHHNKNIKKSGYIVFDKNEKINENLVLTEATKRLGSMDATSVYLIKTETDYFIIYYYTTKLEIERLFVDYEFSTIYPLDFFLLNNDSSGELYGLISEDMFFIKQFNTYKDLETSSKLFYQNDIISFRDNLNYLFTNKAKRVIFNGGFEKIYKLHNDYNQIEVQNYIPFEKRTMADKDIIHDPVPLATNLEIIHYDNLVKELISHKNFSFEDKVSTFYKAKKLKPFLIFFSLLFFCFSGYFGYQFINTQAINYIYSGKIVLLKEDIEALKKKNKEAQEKHFLTYYNPINVSLLMETMETIKQLDTNEITKYTLNIEKDVIFVNIETISLKNVEIMNKIINNKIKDLKLTTNNTNTKFNIMFSYGIEDTKKSKKPTKEKK